MQHRNYFVISVLALWTTTCSTASAFACQSPSNKARNIAANGRNGGKPQQQNAVYRRVLIQGSAKDEIENTLEVMETSSSHESTDVAPPPPSEKGFLIQGLAISISSAAIAAKVGLLPGYTNDLMIIRDIGATIFCAAGAYAVVKGVTVACEQDKIGPKVARKLIHTLTGPIFVACWGLFSAAPGARIFAGLVTLVNGVRLYLAGTGKDASLAATVSRSGDKSEALGGPFIYVVILQSVIWLLWRSNVAGVMAISTMAAGDGLADLVGRKFGGNNKWFFSEDKSIAGTLAFIIGSFTTGLFLTTWLTYCGCMQPSMDLVDLSVRVLGISVACSIVELLPIGDDNYNVPIAGFILGTLLLN